MARFLAATILARSVRGLRGEKSRVQALSWGERSCELADLAVNLKMRFSRLLASLRRR